MRHLKSGRALGVKPAHRRAMLRNLVTSLLEHEQITTTVARAKELRKPLDKMITLGKRGDLSARRRALSFVKSKKAMEVLFGEFAERYAERPGGFARVVRKGVRRGDGAEMAIVQLVGSPNDPFTDVQKPPARRGGRGGRAGKKDETAAQAKETAKGKKQAAAEAEGKEAPEEAVEETAAEEKAEAAPEETAAAKTEDGAVPEEKAEASAEETNAEKTAEVAPAEKEQEKEK